MKRALLLFLLASLVTPAVAQNDGNVVAGCVSFEALRQEREGSLLHCRGDVQMTTHSFVLRADEVDYHSNTGIVEERGNVRMQLLPATALGSQQPHNGSATQSFIERLEITGNRRVELTTIMAQIRSRPGDSYDGEAVQRDAQALRDTGYFDEVRLRVEDALDKPNGKMIAFDVKEKPIIRRIAYRGIKSINEADLLGAYKNNKINLSVETWFDPEKLTRAATVIEELLAAHGHPSATVKPSYEIAASLNVVSILFTVNEGPKAKSSPNSH